MLKKINLTLLALFLSIGVWSSGGNRNPKAMQELNAFLKRYVEATNSHEFAQVRPLLMPNAVYWFNQKESSGLEQIRESFQASWSYLPDEVYGIQNVTWLSVEQNSATCIYQYTYQGTHEGKPVKGGGRGTTVLVRQGGQWRIVHEHLSIPL